VDNFKEAEQEREKFKIAYFGIRSQMHETINIEKVKNSSINSNNGSSHKARLASITLSKFEGNIQEWQSFFDCYKTMVHYDNSYPLKKWSQFLEIIIEEVKVVSVEDIDERIRSVFSTYRQRVDSIRNELKMEFWQLVMFFSKNLTASRRERISM